ncbi:MAG: hypothetical protein LBS46_04750 [Dysgonamonadaceae bacterium]|jgi:hypothetical protein|nr:hypothetical protein [Dysgonamonadaceae bacterium]
MKTSKQTVFYASILLVSLHLVLGSCEKEWPEAGSGEKIPVRFLLQQASYGGGESLTRSSASGTGEEASSIVPLGDNLYLYASLEVVPPEPTRAPLTFNSSAQIIVAAYEGSSTTATASAVYEVNGSAFIPYNSGPELKVDPGTYTFVAYSYNSSSPLTHSTSETVSLSPANEDDGDFLWGTTTASVSAGNNAITITMTRRLSKASVRVTTPSSSYPITAISGITIGPGHSVDMQLSDGSFTSTASTIPQPVSNYTGLTTNTVNTDPRIVCTNGSTTTTVTIGSITINSKTYTDLTTVFNKQLESNKSYILRVDIRLGIAWAGSNVYWDGTKLTFKPYGYVGDENNYQGVFFKWGSLVGISPSKGNNANWDTDTSTGTATYVPSYTNPLNHSWSIVNGGNWSNILSLYGMDIQSNTGFGADFFESYSDYANRKGDICRYLSHIDAVSGDYRMPTYNELRYGMIKGTSESTITYDIFNWQSSMPTINGYFTRIGDWIDITTATNATGQYILVSGVNYSGYATFPASGYRFFNIGNLGGTGSYCAYWSSSVSSGTMYANDINCPYDGLFGVYDYHHRDYGLSVRCVREE